MNPAQLNPTRSRTWKYNFLKNDLDIALTHPLILIAWELGGFDNKAYLDAYFSNTFDDDEKLHIEKVLTNSADKSNFYNSYYHCYSHSGYDDYDQELLTHNEVILDETKTAAMCIKLISPWHVCNAKEPVPQPPNLFVLVKMN
jgi:hypothetical protein